MKIGKLAAPSHFNCPFNVPVGLSLYLSQFAIAQNITLQDLLEFFTKQDIYESKDKYHDAKSGFECELLFFDAIDGYPDEESSTSKRGTLEATVLLNGTLKATVPLLPVSHASCSSVGSRIFWQRRHWDKFCGYF